MYLVVGATGNIGKHVVTELVARGEQVRALTRDADRAGALLGEDVEVVAGDLADKGVLTRALTGITGAFIAIPSNEAQVQLEIDLVDAAVDAGVERLVKASVIGADAGHFVRYARWHAAIEAHLATSALAATILRPNWFDENFFGSAPTIVDHGAMYGSAGDGRVGFVDSRDTAAVAAVALTETGHTGREYVVTGPAALTFAEAAVQLANGTGRPVAYVDLPEDGLREALLGAGLPPDIAEDVLDINRNALTGGLDQVTTTVADLTGRPPRSLAEWAGDNAAAFRTAA